MSTRKILSGILLISIVIVMVSLASVSFQPAKIEVVYWVVTSTPSIASATPLPSPTAEPTAQPSEVWLQENKGMVAGKINADYAPLHKEADEHSEILVEMTNDTDVYIREVKRIGNIVWLRVDKYYPETDGTQLEGWVSDAFVITRNNMEVWQLERALPTLTPVR